MSEMDSVEESPTLHVFDLPQIHAKPSAEVLLETLSLLTSTPPSWDCSDSEDEYEHSTIPGRPRTIGHAKVQETDINPEGLARYLTNIVSSDLRWIQDDDAKEEIWNQASLRLSERSGRSAMPALSRTFRIPIASGSVDVVIHEPALTADNLGLKTWAASYLLAKRLKMINLPLSSTPASNTILELGAGTGLVGIAAAATFRAPVILTDLPEIAPNLFRNIKANIETVESCGGSTRCGVLDWSQPNSLQSYSEDAQSIDRKNTSIRPASGAQRVGVILAADSLYSPEHPRLLVQTIETWLSFESTARVIVEFPFREAYVPEIHDFRDRMCKIGLHILDEGEEKGYDDWSSVAKRLNSRNEVRCWWSVWGRHPK